MFVDKSIETIGWKNSWILTFCFVISMIKTWPGLFGLYSFQLTSSNPVSFHCDMGNKSIDEWIPKDVNTGKFKKCEEYINPDINNETQKCSNGYTYEMGQMKSSLIKDYNMVCDLAYLRKIKDGSVLSFVFIGSIINAIFSDKYGRRIVLLISFTGCNLVALLLYFTMNAYYFIVFQIFAGIMQEASYATGFTLLLEFFAIKHRANACLANSFMWISGGMMLCLVSFIFRNTDFRYIYLTTCLMMQIPFMFVYCYLPESLRWLHANGKTECLKKTLVHIGKYSKPPITEEMFDQINEEAKKLKQDDAPFYATIDLFKYAKICLYLLMNSLLWFTTGMTYYGIQIAVVENSHNIFVNFVLSFLTDLPANLLVYLISDRLGRRIIEALCTVLVIFLMTGAVVCFILLDPENKWPPNICMLFAKAANAGLYNIIFMHTGELFPTSLRSTTIGFGSATSRIGAATGVAVSMFLPNEQSVFYAILLFNVLSLIAIFILPETLNKELPRTIQQTVDLKLSPTNIESKTEP